jgi:hypothetical protein
MKTTETGRIVEQLRQVHDGGAWHGPSVREALEGVEAPLAYARPIAGGHSIGEIVHHLRVVADAVRGHLTGDAATEEADWPVAPKETSEKTWRALVARLEASLASLREAAVRLPDAKLHEKIPGKGHSYWYELLGALHHDAYHAGQIALLKKGA